jgi:hypothetical protein
MNVLVSALLTARGAQAAVLDCIADQRAQWCVSPCARSGRKGLSQQIGRRTGRASPGRIRARNQMNTQHAVLYSPSATVSNGFRDSAFAGNRDLPVHRWVPWIAGFSTHFVDDCLSKYIPANGKKDHCVLDPFAGVGTTLLQAYSRGFNVIGFEINPSAKFSLRWITSKALKCKPYETCFAPPWVP